MRTATASSRSLLITYGALLALLALTLGLSYVHLGTLGVVLALMVSAVKTALILLVFMELGRESAPVRLVSAAGVFWLLILLGFVLSDYLSRSPASH